MWVQINELMKAPRSYYKRKFYSINNSNAHDKTWIKNCKTLDTQNRKIFISLATQQRQIRHKQQ